MRPLALIGAFVRRDFATARSYRFQLILELLQIAFSLILFFYLARVIDGQAFTRAADLDSGYFAFTVIGLVVLEIVQVGLISLAETLRRDQTTGTLEALFAAPASPAMVALGSTAYDMLRAVIVGAVTLGGAVALFGLALELESGSDVLALILAVPATVVLCVAAGVALAAFTLLFQQTTALLSFATTAVALLAGVYFPTSVLPAGLEQVADALPFTWSLDVLRGALLGGEVPAVELGLLVGVSAAAVPAALLAFTIALRRARRAGTLAQY